MYLGVRDPWQLRATSLGSNLLLDSRRKGGSAAKNYLHVASAACAPSGTS